MRIDPQKIKGRWRVGWALDVHTLSSTHLLDGSFDTQRSPIGESLFRLKYRADRSQVAPVAECAAEFLRNLLVFPYLAAIVPVPPSDASRALQPVLAVAQAVGKLVDLPAPLDYLVKNRATRPLKNIEDKESRERELQGAFRVADDRYRGRYVLLFDDLFRSGETLNATTDALMALGGVSKVYALVLTRTRTKH